MRPPRTGRDGVNEDVNLPYSRTLQREVVHCYCYFFAASECVVCAREKEVRLKGLMLLLVVWLSGNTLASINVVALRQTRLVLGWVTVYGWVNHLGM